MPSFRVCTYPGCTILSRGPCPKHGGWRGTQPMPAGWSRRRNAYLASHPWCEWAGCKARAVTVDHIVARTFGGTEDESNLRSLCRDHAKTKDVADSQEGQRRARQGS